MCVDYACVCLCVITSYVIAEVYTSSLSSKFASLSKHILMTVILRRPTCIEFIFLLDLRNRLSVNLVNAQGLDEAGIDGGGLFREFLAELLRTGFDPNRGFFTTTADALLYPNPQVRTFSACDVSV